MTRTLHARGARGVQVQKPDRRTRFVLRRQPSGRTELRVAGIPERASQDLSWQKQTWGKRRLGTLWQRSKWQVGEIVPKRRATTAATRAQLPPDRLAAARGEIASKKRRTKEDTQRRGRMIYWLQTVVKQTSRNRSLLSKRLFVISRLVICLSS